MKQPTLLSVAALLLIAGCNDSPAAPLEKLDVTIAQSANPNPSAASGRSLQITVSPGDAVPGAPFGVQPEVVFHSAAGKLLPVGQEVVATIVGSSEPLLGTTVVRASAGVATFTDLSIATEGTYTLQFSAPGASPVQAILSVTGACTYRVTPPTLVLDSYTSARSVTVTASDASCPWRPEVLGGGSWLRLAVGEDRDRSGSGSVRFSVLSNRHQDLRTASIQIVAGVELQITQQHGHSQP